MKRIVLFLLTALLLCGCHREQDETLPSFSLPAETAPAETILPETTEPSLLETAFSFEELKYLEFYFNSGAGAWGTVLVIHPDGSFTGTFQDTDMGSGEEPEYPDGTVYLSNFSGHFSPPVCVDEYRCTLKIEDIQYENEPETSEIRDGVLYLYHTAYGLTETEELVLYLPGTPISELPEDYIPWAGLYGHEGTEFPHYGLYNPGHKTGFYSLNILDKVRFSVQTAEEAAAEVDTWLEEAYTQADMNYAAQQKYQVWDEALNQLWRDLKEILSEEEMRQLTNEELQWIKEKEQAALDAAAEYEGGSMYPMVYSATLASLTRERVYELLEWLPEA